MNRALALPIAGLLLLAPACTGPTDLAPSDLCSDHGSDDVPHFEDPNLEGAVRSAVRAMVGREGGGTFPDRQDLSCDLVGRLTTLTANNRGIGSLAGIQNLASLASLNVQLNDFADTGPLSGLVALRTLWASGNRISDIGPLGSLAELRRVALDDNELVGVDALRGLVELTSINLDGNAGLSDVRPLLENPALGPGDEVFLRSTAVSCLDVAALEAKGVLVDSDCN